MNIFGENLRSFRSSLFHSNSVHDKNAGKHATYYFFFRFDPWYLGSTHPKISTWIRPCMRSLSRVVTVLANGVKAYALRLS